MSQGAVQGAIVPKRSSRHWNVTPVSVEEKTAVAFGDSVTAVGRPERLGTGGATVSTVQPEVSAWPWLPAASVCLTETLCGPLVRRLIERGEVQAPYEPESTEQLNVAPSSPVMVSEALVELVGDVGVPLIPGLAGATVSIVNWLVMESLMLPTASMALTLNA